MIDQIRRLEATNKTLAKYRNRAFDWHGASCIHLVRFHALAMGHAGLPKLPPFRSATGALTALRGQGCNSLTELMDKHFARIAPAQMMLGDVAVLPGDAEAGANPFASLVIFDGIGSLLGWHASAPEGVRAIKNAMASVELAWRL